MQCGTSKYKTARDMSGLTQEAAAERAFTSVSTIKRIESTGRCERSMAECLAKIYDAPYVADPTVADDYRPIGLIHAAFHYKKEIKDICRLDDTIMDVCDDGIINITEEADKQLIRKELREAMEAMRDLDHALAVAGN